MLGYKSHAAYVLEVRMAKKPESVLGFLETLNKNLTPLFDKEKAQLLKLKQEEQKARGEPVESELLTSDRSYYTRLWTERTFKVDQEEVKEYFPLEIVTQVVMHAHALVSALRAPPLCRTQSCVILCLSIYLLV